MVDPTAPATDWRSGEPLYDVPLAVGQTVADVDRTQRPHMCGRCMNPFLTEGHPECPNR